MKVLVTGSNGQLGKELRLLSRKTPEIEFLFTDLEEMDITDRSSVENTFNEFKPSWLINCAAYTGVDKAEQEPEKVILINAFAPGLLASIASQCNSRIIHISTDYVFDGNSSKPYREDHKSVPLESVYAKSKAEGEENVLSNCSSAIIIRTSWLYSWFGNNFVKTIRRVGSEHGELKVVADQIGSPTWARDLAEAIYNLIELNAEPGIYHFANEGICSWYDFAKAIVEFSGIECIVNPTDTESYPLPSPRPFYSVLDKSKYKAFTRKSIPYWRDSLKKCIALLNEQK
ncbi:MAG: dTDP-4-dehydrorhamnose reductase [Bacteroidetes bacterium HGW-Bacteroidetes-9]|jgi:dTDP-4-dehydrorhamnose reductase|nr:MAG: dTDP-4-dehydrorhamnose reductase [Bacteroidetes bacterium HGW-Bacteroidetes-9]